MEPYIGVTGFTTPQEVAIALEALPEEPPRKLMVGILASSKSIRGIPLNPARAKRYPALSKIPALLTYDPRVVNLIHYSVGDTLGEFRILSDLIQLRDIAGPNLHGFQLNVAWPETRALDDYRHTFGWGDRIVLQVNQRALEELGEEPERVAERLYDYAGVINDILLDVSGGLGKPLDVARSLAYLKTVARRQYFELGLGVAGGLGPGSLNLVHSLLRELPNLNIDAERNLRDENDALHKEKVRTYLAQAFSLFE